MAKQRGYIVAFEGPKDIVSSQFDLLPESVSILKIGSLARDLAAHDNYLDCNRGSANIHQFVWGVERITKTRFKKAKEFLATGNPGEVRIVLLEGGAAGATRVCIDAIKRHVPSVGGDITRAEKYLADMLRDGVISVDTSPEPQTESNDPLTQAMRAAEDMDAKSFNLQLESAYQNSHAPATLNKGKTVETQDTATADDTMLAIAHQPDSHFSSWDTPSDASTVENTMFGIPQSKSHFTSWNTASDNHSSGHISTAHEVSFQQARLVPIPTSGSDRLAHKEGESSDISWGSDGRPRPPRTVREARRQEALMLLEGEAQSDATVEPILPLSEDLVFLLQGETSSETLNELAAAYGSGCLHADNVRQSFGKVELLELLTTDYATAIELQNKVRSELRRWFAKHEPALNLSIFTPILDRNTLADASQAALAIIDERTDLILALSCQEGASKRSYQSVVEKLVRLGKPDGKTYSRAGRCEFKRLLTELMVAHTSQPLLQQTYNPLENDSTTAEAILSQVAAYLSSHPQTRFLVINFAQRHLPTVVALRAILGRKMKIAAVVSEGNSRKASSTGAHNLSDAELSPLAQNPPARTSFSEADWKMEVNPAAEATGRLILTTKVWRALREANDWYNPGAEDDLDNGGNRISIAVATEGKSKAPRVARPISIAKCPEGYELGRSNFSHPLVPASPASPPDSIPESRDGPAPAPFPPSASHPPTGQPLRFPPLPPHSPHGRACTAPPASPEPTIGSSASGSSGSSWKVLAQMLQRSGPPSIDSEGGTTSRLAKKLSALFGPQAVENSSARGKPISTPHLESTTSRAAAGGAVRLLPSAMALRLPPAPPRHPPGTASAGGDAPVTGSDDGDDEEHDDDMDEEERRVLGRFGSRRGMGDADDKARRMLGLP
ncbi:hypothetical protein NKR19_g7254 [Coniochaeta hoffmannii]|uniref:Uncharacterized protein n=1 Tax=Coniochaeta hoffmannii TaxID=91930 RepID=A0AA38VMW2_9PEZI|nr:hypothetical protein NKR19_g7254 [Coniochaeta hoffmannii]